MNKVKIPQEWKFVTLSEISTEIISGGTPLTSSTSYWGGKIPWARSAWLTKKYITAGERTITEDGLENSSSKIIPKNNIIIATRVSLGNLSINKIDVAINQDLTGIIIDRSKASEEFVYFSLINDPSKITSHAQGSTIKGITRRQLESILILLPPLSEQQKIASILSNVDSLIQQTQKIIEQTQRLKKGLMQKLLTRGIGHTRFKKVKWHFGKYEEIPTNWEDNKIGELIRFEGGAQPPRTDFVFEPKEGYVRMIQIRDFKTSRYSTYIPKRFARKFFEKDDVMIGRYGPPNFQILRGLSGAYNVALIKTIPKTEIEKDYIYYFLKQEKFFHLMDNLGQRTAGQDGVELDILKKLPFPLPPKNERRKIISILSNIDSQIQKHQEYKTHLELLKKGLMQKLLTGQIRVKV